MQTSQEIPRATINSVRAWLYEGRGPYNVLTARQRRVNLAFRRHMQRIRLGRAA